MYHYRCDNFDEMTDINKVLRGKLKEVAEIRTAHRKWLKNSVHPFTAPLNGRLSPLAISASETVYIPEDAPCSSQVGCALECKFCSRSASLRRVGCALECKFCSTAQQGFNRNLRVSEIIGQVWRAAKSSAQQKSRSAPNH